MGSILTTMCNSDARLDGKTALITGANSGIGKETAKDFYERGARVILACRNVDKAKEAIEDIKKQCDTKQNLGDLKFIQLDLSSQTSIRECTKELIQKEEEINILVNNAGIYGIPERRETEDGYELQFGTNHLGPFLFTLLLLPKLIQSRPVRIVNVSSLLHKVIFNLKLDDLNYEKRRYGAQNAYGQSKLCNILFTNELDRKLKDHNINGINVYSVHPGAVNTDISKNLPAFSNCLWNSASAIFSKTPQQGAQTQIYCSVHEKCANESGLYYAECDPTCISKVAKNKEVAERLWNISVKMVGLENYNPFESQ